MFFKQIPIGSMSNFSYLFGCERTLEAAVVDPAFDTGKILRQASVDGYHIKYILTTHTHFDHIGGHKSMIDSTGAKVVVHRLEADQITKNQIPADIIVEDGDEIRIGDITVRVIHTPGHTPGAICLLIDREKLITGDTLFIGDCGRTDLPGGSSKALYESIQKLAALDPGIEVYPGHDYGEKPYSTIGEEKKTNPAMLCRTLEEFNALP